MTSATSAQPDPPLSPILFVFLDGIGLAAAGPDNPFSQVAMPHLEGVLGGGLTLETLARLAEDGRPGLVLRALDACLGVPGLPQSATGQTALFTGVNAAAAVGDHVTAQPTGPLREIIAEHSVLKRAAEAGARVLFANAHSQRFWDMVERRRRRLGASTLTALAAGADIPDLEDLEAGRAVLWDITHEIASGHLDYGLPIVSAWEAGQRLAHLATEYDLVLYESFLPDLAGHRRLEPAWVLERLDDFLGAVLACRDPGLTVLVCSDHGNIEDSSTKMHSVNPVPLLAVGPGAGWFNQARDLLDVAPAILTLLGDGPETTLAGI